MKYSMVTCSAVWWMALIIATFSPFAMGQNLRPGTGSLTRDLVGVAGSASKPDLDSDGEGGGGGGQHEFSSSHLPIESLKNDPSLHENLKNGRKLPGGRTVHVEMVEIVNNHSREIWLYGTQNGHRFWNQNRHGYNDGDVRSFAPGSRTTFRSGDRTKWVPWHYQRMQAAFFQQPANQNPTNGNSLVFEMNSNNWSFDIPQGHWSWQLQTGFPAGLNMMVEIFTEPHTLLCDGTGNPGTNIGRARTNFPAGWCDQLEFCSITTKRWGERYDPVCPNTGRAGSRVCHDSSCFYNGRLTDFAAYASVRSEAWKDGQWVPSMVTGPTDNRRCKPRSDPGSFLGFDLSTDQCSSEGRPWGVSFECWDDQNGPQGWPILSSNVCSWPDTVHKIKVTLSGDADGSTSSSNPARPRSAPRPAPRPRPNPRPQPQPAPTSNGSTSARCSANPGCAHLAGDCCPVRGMMLACCRRGLEEEDADRNIGAEDAGKA